VIEIDRWATIRCSGLIVDMARVWPLERSDGHLAARQAAGAERRYSLEEAMVDVTVDGLPQEQRIPIEPSKRSLAWSTASSTERCGSSSIVCSSQ